MANLKLASNQKVPFVVNHVDGSQLKVGNSIRVSSPDPTGATVVPDPAPLVGLATGFVVGGTNLQTGLNIVADEIDSTGAVVDSTSIAIDIVAAGAATNLVLTLGTPVPQGPKTATSFANPFGR